MDQYAGTIWVETIRYGANRGAGGSVDIQGEQDWRRNGQHTTCKRGGSIAYKPEEELHDTSMLHHIALCTGCPSSASSLMSHKDTLKGTEGTEGILSWWRSMLPPAQD